MNEFTAGVNSSDLCGDYSDNTAITADLIVRLLVEEIANAHSWTDIERASRALWNVRRSHEGRMAERAAAERHAAIEKKDQWIRDYAAKNSAAYEQKMRDSSYADQGF